MSISLLGRYPGVVGSHGNAGFSFLRGPPGLFMVRSFTLGSWLALFSLVQCSNILKTIVHTNVEVYLVLTYDVFIPVQPFPLKFLIL